MHYDWHHVHNAIGFGAECVREVFFLYKGRNRWAVRRALELAESYGRCPTQDARTVGRAANRADKIAAGALDTISRYVATGASRVAHAAALAASERSLDSLLCVTQAVLSASMAYTEVHDHDPNYHPIHFRWVVTDMGFDPASELGRAAFALVAIGEYAAAERLREDPCP